MNNIIQISVDTLEGSHQKIEAVVLRCSIKTVLLKFYQNSQETTRARVSQLIRSQAPACGHRLFPANFGKYSRTLFYRAPPAVASERRFSRQQEA